MKKYLTLGIILLLVSAYIPYLVCGGNKAIAEEWDPERPAHKTDREKKRERDLFLKHKKLGRLAGAACALLQINDSTPLHPANESLNMAIVEQKPWYEEFDEAEQLRILDLWDFALESKKKGQCCTGGSILVEVIALLDDFFARNPAAQGFSQELICNLDAYQKQLCTYWKQVLSFYDDLCYQNLSDAEQNTELYDQNFKEQRKQQRELDALKKHRTPPTIGSHQVRKTLTKNHAKGSYSLTHEEAAANALEELAEIQQEDVASAQERPTTKKPHYVIYNFRTLQNSQRPSSQY